LVDGFAGTNPAAVYAALNNTESPPLRLTTTHPVLAAVKTNASYLRAPVVVAPKPGLALGVPQELALPFLTRRPVCVPVVAVYDGLSGGAVVSNVVVACGCKRPV
jgi:hypothetical protein